MEIDNEEVKRLQAEYDAKEYESLRKVEYKLIKKDEMRYDDLVNGKTNWQDDIAAIKLAHPKP